MSVVLRHYWGLGGGGLLCAASAYALEKLGLYPALAGTFKFSPADYAEWYGIDISSCPTVTLPIGAQSFGLLSQLFTWYPARKAVKMYKPKILFTDQITYKPLLSEKDFSLIEYVHFPPEIMIDPSYKRTGLAYGDDPQVSYRYSKFPMSLYWNTFTKLLPLVARDNPFDVADAVLTNSKWTARVAKSIYGKEPTVLNPPIAPNVQKGVEERNFEERDQSIAMVGRFVPEKRYHWVIRNVIPDLTKDVPDAKLVIIGGADTPVLRSYLYELAYEVKMKNLPVELIANASTSSMNAIMNRAKVFLHATINEHWGIAVAEAMAKGLPAVVHASGGTWSDLVEEGKNGLGYNSAEQAVENLAKMLTDPKSWRYYSNRSKAKASSLTLDNYVKNFGSILHNLISGID